MEQLIEDYERRLATCKEMLKVLETVGGFNSVKWRRITTKAACYRTFIAELKEVRDKTLP